MTVSQILTSTFKSDDDLIHFDLGHTKFDLDPAAVASSGLVAPRFCPAIVTLITTITMILMILMILMIIIMIVVVVVVLLLLLLLLLLILIVIIMIMIIIQVMTMIMVIILCPARVCRRGRPAADRSAAIPGSWSKGPSEKHGVCKKVIENTIPGNTGQRSVLITFRPVQPPRLSEINSMPPSRASKTINIKLTSNNNKLKTYQ